MIHFTNKNDPKKIAGFLVVRRGGDSNLCPTRRI